ncbi:MAG: hypothetical protein CXT75_10680 [Methanobacteriota archaeon]|nr:MAG: hypothetical protein CXT75_10680 [Euryarchaeota archaeon]
MAEDEDIELDSEEYRKWRSGGDNYKYASSKTPTETGSKNGSYTIPKDDDEYALPGEDDEEGGKSWLDADLNWPIIIAVFVIFAIVASAIVAFAISSGEFGSNPSEWPETEGIIIEQTNSEMLIDGEFCEDENDDGRDQDWECWKEFVFIIDLTTQYSVDNETYQIIDYVDFWESHWVEDLEQDGEEQVFENFTNYWNEEAANGSISLNSTVGVMYNPENPEEAYSEFSEMPGDPMGFLGYFLMCIAGVMCFPIIIVGFIINQARNAVTGGRGNRVGRWGPFGGGYFGNNNRHHRGGRNRGTTRRSGGTSRSSGGGRSGGGSRSGGGRSGGGSRSGGGRRR